MKKRKFLSFMLILSLCVGMVGILNVEPSYAASKKIHVKKKTVVLQVGQRYQQKLIAKNGKAIKAKKVKWKSKNAAVARISKKGKITAVNAGTAKLTAKYKGKTYKFTVKVNKPVPVDPKQYTNSDLLNVLTYTGEAQEWAENISIDAENFRIDNFSRYSNEIGEMKKDTHEARLWLEKARSITKNKYTRYCTYSKATEEGFTTWDDMLDSIIEECLYIENVDISSLNGVEVAGLATKAVTVVKHINIAYLEFYYRGY